MRTVLLAIGVVLGASSAHAATIASGQTEVGDTGGINLQGAGVAQTASNTSIASFGTAEAVWGSGGSFSTEVFEFDFDLTGFDLASVALSGLIAVDNTVSVALNGTPFFSLPNVVTSNFTQANAYSTSDASLFNQAGNTVVYTVADAGGPFGFRATVEVTGDPSGPAAIPLPASLPLVLAGVAALGLVRRRAGPASR
ncbi:MAG: VPLPA-CTERM sorting domain-containing protein [Paracoccaceae bacterium]|jgi:hypothetical protein|nr:VPLPA-CTERM sorting domain-containing protein [Paracoccaceae bacterium]